MTGWSINAAELRIPRSSRFAAHRMIVIADPKLDAVRQLNGLASWLDPASGGGQLRDRLHGAPRHRQPGQQGEQRAPEDAEGEEEIAAL